MTQRDRAVWVLSGDPLYAWLARHLDPRTACDPALSPVGGVLINLSFTSRRRGLEAVFKPGTTLDTVHAVLPALARAVARHGVLIPVRTVHHNMEYTARVPRAVARAVMK